MNVWPLASVTDVRLFLLSYDIVRACPTGFVTEIKRPRASYWKFVAWFFASVKSERRRSGQITERITGLESDSKSDSSHIAKLPSILIFFIFICQLSANGTVHWHRALCNNVPDPAHLPWFDNDFPHFTQFGTNIFITQITI